MENDNRILTSTLLTIIPDYETCYSLNVIYKITAFLSKLSARKTSIRSEFGEKLLFGDGSVPED